MLYLPFRIHRGTPSIGRNGPSPVELDLATAAILHGGIDGCGPSA